MAGEHEWDRRTTETQAKNNKVIAAQHHRVTMAVYILS